MKFPVVIPGLAFDFSRKSHEARQAFRRALLREGNARPAPVTGYVRSNLSPLGKDVVIVADEPGLAPQGEKRHLQLRRRVFLVMFEINGCRGAIVLAHGMDPVRLGKTAKVVGEGGIGDRAGGTAPLPAFAAKVELGIGADHPLGQGAGWIR